jgi:hypothetical protein
VVDSTVAVYGELAVKGRVRGSVVVVNGNLVVSDGGSVDGDAIVVRGSIVAPDGAIRGSSIALAGDMRMAGEALPRRSGFEQVKYELGVSLSVMAIMLGLGIGVLLLSGPHLTGTAEALLNNPGKSFFVGILGQIAVLPVMVLMIVALVLTLIGILLVPFAIVAYMLAVLGVSALGLLASAFVVGTAIGGNAIDRSARGKSLRAITLGTFVLGAVWLASAIFTTTPAVGSALRGFAMVMTWVAVTSGVGAALLSRFGRRHRQAEQEEEAEVWQTPTPVTGVAAAPRPASSAAGGRQ